MDIINLIFICMDILLTRALPCALPMIHVKLSIQAVCITGGTR